MNETQKELKDLNLEELQTAYSNECAKLGHEICIRTMILSKIAEQNMLLQQEKKNAEMAASNIPESHPGRDL
jgi:hypothetical protein